MHSPQGSTVVEPKEEKEEVFESEKLLPNLLVPEKERADTVDSGVPLSKDETLQNPENIPPLSALRPENEDPAYVSNQLVVYDPEHNQPTQVSPPGESTVYQTQNSSGKCSSQRVLPSIGTFTVQCALCLKWRIIPTKEEYEAIRETIIEEPFVCEYAKKWRPDISCDDPHDLEPDDTKIWAIDKPNISQPPPGWQRLLRIRSEGSSKFADVYYVAPTGKRLRSMIEVQKFLLSHPEYMQAGVNLSQFSYQIPRPLNDGYVRKRGSARAAHAHPNGDVSLPLPEPVEPVEPSAVNPLAWAGPPSYSELQDSMITTSCAENTKPSQRKRSRPQLG
ncbi:methyl-CpG-binding domain-containing protein 2-like [Nymphaea colorata]|nr:methyl-CpG-binding domain-containing protein 2-like [Nymphaea colorata]XP_031504467.1 methyl-CpG-binding domain-containing protein 2-like [Nymphaea colorata]XP_031504468.1 methyl-CpG-binding domain-containing protein 2-like [Nymphaea colorata]XP_031504469.1 methyl-CpG-binding domain-containing protein 2-like [Nymphaea colorata]